MKHFIDARLGSVAALSHPDLPALAEKSCLIVDLQGKMRVLAKLKVGADADALRNKLTQIVAPAADVYWYLEKLARINYEFLYASAAEAGATESPLHQLLKSLRAKLKPDLILVDSRAGFHDLGGLSLSGIAHLQVLFGLNSAQSWAGLSLVVAHLGKEMVLSGKAQRGCAMVQTLAPPQEPSRKEHVENFKERSFEVFSENYYDPPGPDGEWPMPDPEAAESPHFPAVLTWDNRVFGYSSVASVVDYLCEGEYRNLAAFILDKVGRTLE